MQYNHIFEQRSPSTSSLSTTVNGNSSGCNNAGINNNKKISKLNICRRNRNKIFKNSKILIKLIYLFVTIFMLSTLSLANAETIVAEDNSSYESNNNHDDITMNKRKF